MKHTPNKRRRRWARSLQAMGETWLRYFYLLQDYQTLSGVSDPASLRRVAGDWKDRTWRVARHLHLSRKVLRREIARNHA